MLRIEVVIMHHSRQVLGYFKFSLDEGSIDDELRGFIRKLACAPGFNLPAHRLEVALHAVHPHREDVDESCECSEAENPVDYFQCQRCVILLHQFGTDSEVDAGTLPAENRFGLGRYPFRVRR